MSTYTVRALDPSNPAELDTVVIFSIMTLWESRPELRVDPDTIPDMSFKATKAMYARGMRSRQQNYLVATDPVGNVVGHSVSVVRTADGGTKYGYFWSRYVLPDHRRRGLAEEFLRRALGWFRDADCAWAEVHVHVENAHLRALFAKHGFRVVDRRTERWTYVVMRRDLDR